MSNSKIYVPKVSPRRVARSVRGIEYAVTEWGRPESPLLIWLHGFADTGTTFQFVVDELQEDWFVVAPDWRGFGHTRVDTQAFWFPDYLADLDHLLQQYSAEAPVNIAGHSMGGNVAGLYAGAMPDRVAALVNVEGFGLPDTDPQDAPGHYRDWLLRSRTLPPPTVRDDFAALAAAICRRSPRLDEARAGFIAREWAQQTPEGQVQLHPHPAHKLPNAVLYRRAEVEACWRLVAAPVLLVAGRQSEFPSPEALPFPDHRTAWIDDAGHMLHFEQPAALARVIEEFLVKPST